MNREQDAELRTSVSSVASVVEPPKREHACGDAVEWTGSPQGVSDGEIANQNAGRIFTAFVPQLWDFGVTGLLSAHSLINPLRGKRVKGYSFLLARASIDCTSAEFRMRGSVR
jgi:hypothetical protein